MNTFLQLALTQIWQTAAVALAVAIVVQFVGRRRPHLAYLLWLVVIAKSLTPPIWSSPAGVFSWTAIAGSAPSTVELPPATPAPISPQSAPTTVAASTVAPPLALNSESNALPISDWLTATNVLPLVWVAGTAILAALFVVNWFRILGRLRRTALPLEPAWRERFRACTRQLGLRRNIRFVVTSEPLGPAVSGVFRPVIVLPHSVFAKEPSALEPIVAHELAHIRRGDALAALFQAFAQCVWWFHPCVWWANREANRERERACDEEVLATFRLEPAAYAQCLVDVLRMKQTLLPIVAFPGVRAIEVTKRRLEHIMQADSTFHSRTPRWCWAIALVAALVALPGANLAFDSEPKPAEAANGAGNAAAVIKRVLDHMRAREEGIKTFHVAWESKDYPHEDLWMKGNAYRVAVAKVLNRGGWWRAFDGAATRAYEGRDRTGDISAGNQAIKQVAGFFPILAFARPFSNYGFDPSPAKWQVLGENAILNNVHCVKLKTTRSHSDPQTIWVDPARDDLIVGWEISLGGGRWSTFVTIDYRRDERHGWVPTRWTETYTPQRIMSTKKTIVDCSINEPIPDEIFAPTFPPETTVLDTRTLERYRISKTGAKVPIAKFDSPETLKIVQSLEQPVDFTIEPEPMKDAFGFIASRYQIKIVIDRAVEHAGVDSSMEVQVNKPGIKLKDVITALLKQAPKLLVYRVENGVLTILPAPRTK
jgi:beta-lactamase regulating signal transducer with metallopeptidase domain